MARLFLTALCLLAAAAAADDNEDRAKCQALKDKSDDQSKFDFCEQNCELLLATTNCPAASTIDNPAKASICKGRPDLCSGSAKYGPYMKLNCAKSCGYCVSSLRVLTCVEQTGYGCPGSREIAKQYDCVKYAAGKTCKKLKAIIAACDTYDRNNPNSPSLTFVNLFNIH